MRSRLAGGIAALEATLVVLVSLCSQPAHADGGRVGGNIDLNAFHHAVDSRGYITGNASQILGSKEISFGLVTSWGYNVLQLKNGDNTYTVKNIISPVLQASFGFNVGLEAELGITLPFHIMSGDVNPDFSDGNPNDAQKFNFDSQGIGDVGFHLKLRFLNTSKSPIGLAVLGQVYVPSGGKDKWISDHGVTVVPWLIVDKEFGHGKFRLGGNVGVKLRLSGDHSYTDDGSRTNPPIVNGMMIPVPSTGKTVQAGTDVPFVVSAAYAISKQKFDVVGEVFGSLPIANHENYFPLEAVAAVKLYLARNSFFLLGGGAGLIPGEAGGANPDVRAFIGIVFEPNIGDRDGDGIKDDVDHCPDEPEDYDDFEDKDGCPEPDNDRDGILDVDDKCPNEPENKNGYQDEDGCPDSQTLDRDGDGIPDDQDACPDDPEDFDNFEDKDGCPEPDNDKDGILDTEDVCPNDPEDKDDWEDKDGCPDPDNDKDRILDKDDKCPNEPETYNGKDDEDGCPDRGLAVRTDTGIEILDKIYFETNKAIIKPVSYPILDAVAATMNGNPDILLLEIQGHTDERNTNEYNLKLSQDRAEAVKQYLIDKGVDAKRLTPRGYGEEKPIDPGHNEAAWSKNRRVEFVILKREGQP
jgi:outer membrane protein OmpA-like peptidoglycan-associated protein